MSNLTFQFIGTGNAFAPGGLCWNGFLVNRKYLFEAPPQALQMLNRLGTGAKEIDAVVISHHHGDHFLGLPFLMLEWKYSRRTRPVRIIGPAGTKQLATDLARSVFPGVLETTHEIEWEELTGGASTAVGDLRLEAVDVQHDPRLSGALGFAATLGPRTFGYTGDTALCDAVLDLARHSDVLVSECASRDENLDVHMNLVKDIPLLRAAMRDDAELVLTHLGPGVDSGGLSNTRVALDGDCYRF